MLIFEIGCWLVILAVAMAIGSSNFWLSKNEHELAAKYDAMSESGEPIPAEVKFARLNKIIYSACRYVIVIGVLLILICLLMAYFHL